MEDKVVEREEREVNEEREACVNIVKKTLLDIKDTAKMLSFDGGTNGLSMAHWQILHLDSLGPKSYRTTVKDQLYKRCLEIAKQNGIRLGLHMKTQLRTVCNDYKLVLSIHKNLKIKT